MNSRAWLGVAGMSRLDEDSSPELFLRIEARVEEARIILPHGYKMKKLRKVRRGARKLMEQVRERRGSCTRRNRRLWRRVRRCSGVISGQPRGSLAGIWDGMERWRGGGL